SLNDITIRMIIERRGDTVFDGSTALAAMKRTFAELVHWLGLENSFPHGAILLTGTGIIPPDEFTLASGDLISIEVTGIGRLTNVVEQRTGMNWATDQRGGAADRNDEGRSTNDERMTKH